MNCQWIENTDTTLPELCEASDGVAVLPLASIESHGPHLPLGSDSLCLSHMLGLITGQETVAVLPVLDYSFVAAARVLPGAVHIRSDLLTELVETICDEAYRNGFDKIVLLHGHGGNDALLGAFARRMLERDKPYAVYILPVFAGSWNQVKELLETAENGHACEMETSMNMVARPDLVDLAALGERTFPSQPGPNVGTAMTPVDWISRHPDMAVGVPQKATREKGEQIFSLWADAVVAHLRLIKQDVICLDTMKSYAARANSLRGQ